VIDKIINPALDYFVGKDRRQFFKIFRLRRGEWFFAGNTLELQSLDDTILDDDFNFAFRIAIAPMNMNGLVFIGVEEDDDSKIFVKLRHIVPGSS
jgi:hypothetical protein